MKRHHLDQLESPKRAISVASDLCGLHAQVMSSAELTLWARIDGLAPDAVQRALWEERTLVKTWAMRGTLHLLPTAEFGTWQAALSARRSYLARAWLAYFDLSEAEMRQLIDAVGAALEREPLTREELATAVVARTGIQKVGELLRSGWGGMLKPAAYNGRLCFAPSAGQTVRFTNPRVWLGEGNTAVAPETALADVTRRYLAAFGPATREDIARWWGVTAPAGGAMLRALGDEVVPVEVEGASAWLLWKHLDELSGAAATTRLVRLLPAFDQYVVGSSKHTRNLLPGEFRSRIFREAAWLSPVLLVNGRMDGVWWHKRKGKRLEVLIEPFVPVPAWARRAAEAEAERLAAFLGGRLELAWG